MDFSKSHDRFWKMMEDTGAAAVSAATGAVYDVAGNRYRVEFNGDEYFVDLRARAVDAASPGSVKAGFETGLILITYLAMGGSGRLSGDWVTGQELPSGAFFFKGVHGFPGDKIIGFCGGDTGKLRDRCLELGGREIPCTGDFCAELRPLPMFPVRMIYWRGDEEFPPRVSFLFDKKADSFLMLDGVLAVVNLMVKKICGR